MEVTKSFISMFNILCPHYIIMFVRRLRKKRVLLSIFLFCVLLVLMSLLHPSPFVTRFHYTSHITRSLRDLVDSGMVFSDSRYIVVGRKNESILSKGRDLNLQQEDVAERLARLHKHSPRAQHWAENGADSASNRSGSKNIHELPPCDKKELSLKGRLKSPGYWNKWPILTPQEMTSKFPELRDGGHYRPTSCRAAEKTAILIPYRDRWDHLHTMLPVLIPMLLRQQIDFTIYVIEQDSSTTYNKGLLFNAGFLEAVNADHYDCFILHDVDMIPLDDRNIYQCLDSGPVHFSAGVDKFAYNSSYTGLFGGVVAFTRHQFEKMNGASNLYFGWGAEDDDLRDRALNKGFVLNRKPAQFGVYDMIKHRWSSGWTKNPDRFKVFAQRLKRQDLDGLNSVTYSVTNVGVFPVYTWISVHFDPDNILKTVPEHLWKASRGDENFEWAPIQAMKS